jgi:transcriptional regulator with XRE-family HTH domain
MTIKLRENLGSLGERIRTLRGRRTAAEYAEELGVHANTLLNYERGERPPNSDILAKLCQLEQVDANWLLLGIALRQKTKPTVGYKRDLLEMIGSAAHELAPHRLGSRFGKMLVMAYEQAVFCDVDKQRIGTIIRDLVDLLEPKGGGCDARNADQDCRPAC